MTPSDSPRPTRPTHATTAEVELRPPTWWAVVSAVAALGALGVAWAVSVSMTPGFDAVAQPISDLQAQNSPSRWVMTAGLLLVGAAHILTALGLRPADIAGRWVLGGGGAAMLLFAATPNHVVGRYYLQHTFAAALTFGLLALWAATSCHTGPRVPWPLRRPVGLAVTALIFALILLTLFGVVAEAETLGLREGGLLVATTAWPAVVALRTKLGSAGSAEAPVRLPR